MTLQKLNLWNKRIDWHIQKKKRKCLLAKNQSFSGNLRGDIGIVMLQWLLTILVIAKSSHLSSQQIRWIGADSPWRIVQQSRLIFRQSESSELERICSDEVLALKTSASLSPRGGSYISNPADKTISVLWDEDEFLPLFHTNTCPIFSFHSLWDVEWEQNW